MVHLVCSGTIQATCTSNTNTYREASQPAHHHRVRQGRYRHLGLEVVEGYPWAIRFGWSFCGLGRILGAYHMHVRNHECFAPLEETCLSVAFGYSYVLMLVVLYHFEVVELNYKSGSIRSWNGGLEFQEKFDEESWRPPIDAKGYAHLDCLREFVSWELRLEEVSLEFYGSALVALKQIVGARV